ncbi:MAG: hypothetical protein IBJ11_01470 [Phycisphaerales bacterium]|nr:hypothetical protein [Phycisphaerales bacterium]
MSATDTSKALNALLKKLKSSHEPPALPERSPMDEFLYSFLLWEASSSKAENALRRIREQAVDDNELRVTRPHDIAAALGKTYPRAEERSLRMRAALHEIYLREHAVTLEPALALSKRDTRKYLESLEGTPPYVAARFCLIKQQAHAIPIDDRLLGRLIAAGIVEEGADVARAEGVLERHLKAEQALETHQLLQTWAEDGAAEPAGKPAKTVSRAAAKSSAARKPAAGKASK